MGWEWRFFFREEVNGAEGGDGTDEAKSPDASVLDRVWEESGIDTKFGPFSKGREDVYFVYRKGCGIKLRNRERLEFKFRTKKLTDTDKLEQWNKFAVQSTNPERDAFQVVLREDKALSQKQKEAYFHPLVKVVTGKVRRSARVHGVAIEDAKLRVYLDGEAPSKAQAWRSVAVEGSKANILAFLASPVGTTLAGVTLPQRIFGGYPSFVKDVVPLLRETLKSKADCAKAK